MFLFERLFGISVYMLVLVFICFLLLKSNIPSRSILKFYLVCLCCMAFLYKPHTTADLYRIFEQMDYFSSMRFGVFWENYAVGSSIPLARLLFWIFGKTGRNELISVFSTFFCYSIIFYVMNKTKQRYDISNKTVAAVLFFVMSTSMYISVIGGIRMMIALSMLLFSFFRATVEKRIKVIDILFLIASVLIHTMSLVVIGIIALTLLFDSNKNVLKKIGYVFFIALIGTAFWGGFSEIVQGVFDKFYDYILGEKYSDPWEYLMGAFIIILLLLVFFEFKMIRKAGYYKEVNKCSMAAVSCMVLAVCFCFEFSIFYRFGGHLAVMFSIPSMMIAMDRKVGQSGIFFKRIDMRALVILFACVIAAISCSRGSLSSLKFFEL